MKRERVKTPRGTARKLRRQDMSIFRAERDKRRDAADASTITFNTYPGSGGRTKERNPHHHSVATVTDMRDGTFVVRQYDWTLDYPANVPCPCRREVSVPKDFATFGHAKTLADEINRIV